MNAAEKLRSDARRIRECAARAERRSDANEEYARAQRLDDEARMLEEAMNDDVEWDIPEDIAPALEQIGTTDIVQGSEEWLNLRAGKITGSKVSDMMAGGQSKTKDSYRVQLAIERITGKPVASGYKSAAMQKGNDDEPLAREYYEFANDADVVQVGFILHPTLLNAGCSPDGLVGDDGLIEIKCPNIETHINYLLSKKIPGNYMSQIQWELACTGRKWCDWMTFSKEMPIHLRSLIIRVFRDEKRIAELESTAKQFNIEVDNLIKQLEVMK